MFIGEVEYQPYNEIVDRIENFNNYHIAGKDSTGEHDVYIIEMGNTEKPTILFTATLHGTEWQGTSYSLSFFESLRDDTYHDKNFRDYLLENFHIIYFPVVNVWGYINTTEYAITQGRLNSTGTNINRDFGEFNDVETRYVRDVVLEHKPFSFLDMHLIRTNVNRDQLLVVGNAEHETEYVRDEIADKWGQYTDLDVTLWGIDDLTNVGVSREWVAGQPNDYTPHTLAFITELARPVNENDGFRAPLSNEEIFNYGQYSMHLFLKKSMEYYNKYNGFIISEIDSPIGNFKIARTMNGITISIEEFKENKTIKTTFSRDEEDIISSIERSLS